jgi:hypothetical protein
MSIDVLSSTARVPVRPPAFLSRLLDRPFTNVERSWLYRSMYAPLVALKWSSFVSDLYVASRRSIPPAFA